jgi:PEP-CTERM motif
MVRSTFRSILSKALLLTTVVLSAPVSADILTGSTVFNFSPNPSVSLNLTVNTTSNVIDIIMSGRNDGWFAVGFGNTDMDGTYAMVIDQLGALTEYQLGNFGMNTELSGVGSVVNSNVVGSTRTVQIQRPYTTSGAPYDVFPSLGGSYPLAGATGAGAFGYHLNRGPGSVFLTSVPEPSSALLVLASVGACFLKRRRR